MSAGPQIAVVIPTRGRETRLAFALDALAGQSLATGAYEVIVVRDGAPPGPRAAAPDGLPVRFIELERRLGPAAARNAGWRAAGAPLIAFTDDDCRPAPDWLRRLLACWQRGGSAADVILQGRTEPDPDERHLMSGLARSQEVRGPNGFYQCCNIAYPRALLERVRGFDPDFGFGGEDTDLGLRATEAGARLQYVDEAIAWHAVHARGLSEAVADGFRWESLPLLVARHPERRRYLRWGLFWKQSHATLVLAAAGLLLARRSRTLAALAALPYLAHKWDRSQPLSARRLAGFAANLPEQLIADAAEVLGTGRAAIRHRTPML